MQKQLSKKSHKPTESSIDDFMKHIRKYNQQSQRYISPKPLIYMYTNPSRHCTLQTLSKSCSKSKTLSNRQQSNSKKSTSKTIRKKVQKMLSLTKKQNIHKKSISSISNRNEKSIKKISRSPVQTGLARSKHKLKAKLDQFKLKPFTTSGKKVKKSKNKIGEPYIKLIETSPIRSDYPPDAGDSDILRSQMYRQNPAKLIEIYSKKLFKVQLYLQQNRNKLGSMLCIKFQEILNQIIESLVQNLKKSLNDLQIDIQKRLTKQMQKEFAKSMTKKEEQIRTVKKICQKITQKFGELLEKQHYSNSLIYSLRRRGIDIDHEFGKAIWGVQNLGGFGYDKLYQSDESEKSSLTHRVIRNQNLEDHSSQKSQVDLADFEFREHPNSQRKQRQKKQKFDKKQELHLISVERQNMEQQKQIQQED